MARLEMKVSCPTLDAHRYAASEVRLPAFEGEMGVRPHHTPFIGALNPGVVWVLDAEAADQEQGFYIPGGFFEVKDDELVLLVDGWEESLVIDYARAERSRDRALARLSKAPTDPDIQITRALASLKRAEARLSLRDSLSPSQVRELEASQLSAVEKKMAVNM